MASNNHGLGRGIEALFADNHINTGESVVHVPLYKLIPNPYQPRSNFDRKSLMELAHSIKEEGVFQPIIVRKSTKSIGQYEILAGERRFRASKLAHKDTIPAIVRDATNEQMMEIAVMENLQREDLTPLEEAKAYQTLINKLHLTQAQVAKRMSKSRSYIANCLRMLHLPEVVKQMLQTRQLSTSQVRAVMAIPNRKLLIKVAKRACEKSLTVKQINVMVNRYHPQQTGGHRHHRTHKSPFLRSAEERLQDKFGTPATITNYRQHKGKVEIDYRSQDDLNRILKILKINLD